MTTGLVYVLHRAADNHFKIGRCLERALKPRLADLRHRYGPLTVVHTELVHEPQMVERIAHKALKEFRRYGEFFEVAADVAITTVCEAAAKVENTPIMVSLFSTKDGQPAHERRLMSRQEYRSHIAAYHG